MTYHDFLIGDWVEYNNSLWRVVEAPPWRNKIWITLIGDNTRIELAYTTQLLLYIPYDHEYEYDSIQLLQPNDIVVCTYYGNTTICSTPTSTHYGVFMKYHNTDRTLAQIRFPLDAVNTGFCYTSPSSIRRVTDEEMLDFQIKMMKH